ncbi:MULTISPECIES: exonuclease domain-containing protein [unclassified Variovorax]|uniref:exonuclease domain-containing protein n=1 Tax=unclassified Variovorax TaxID=663243 RepID=UPI00076C7806|nr:MULTISPECIES: exonuclease domain-containing protein [unclassified Variovorax]KWT98438.1 DNA polymerase III epsilon subunit [Variovorax sp. WDL1]PNG49893.1 DNA polymerase III subunit epsilon [Variovorax sp. B2]PNG50765.1 DNA polymerase III subunit epsilon [Variovorax sp. B4]VTU42132.1 DNA polymerase III subunit epsilon [Variovorax sp. PBL-H6]VTU44228.1 DNA polymerase III subunit epsilon [Variovorax sp. SRS16]
MQIRTIALDTETTGLDAGADRLIEIAALDFDPETGLPTGNTFHRFINPEREIPLEVSRVHGKTWSDLKSEPVFKEVVKDFKEFIAGQHVVIHNAPFDLRFLDEELRLVRGGKMDKIVERTTDTLAMSRRHTTAKVHTLDALCDRYGIDRTKRVLHGAFVDCEMLAAVYPPLLADANQLVARLNAVLPFPLGDAVPDSIEGMAKRALLLADLKKVLEKEYDRYTEPVKKLTAGKDFATELFEVTYTPSTKTDWKKVQANHLEGVDLKQYQTPSSSMYIRYV